MNKDELKRLLLTVAFTQADGYSTANDALREAWYDISKMPWTEEW